MCRSFVHTHLVLPELYVKEEKNKKEKKKKSTKLKLSLMIFFKVRSFKGTLGAYGNITIAKDFHL